jgi:predicted permease
MTFVQELRFALRLLWKSRGATALAVLSIALGIGLTTGIFSVEDAMLLRPLAIEHPEQVVYAGLRGDDGRETLYGWPDYQDIRQACAPVGEFAAYQRRSVMMARGDENELLLATPATSNYFSLLGVRAALGRASLAPLDGRPAVVLGYHTWKRLFGGDERIIGRAIALDNNVAFTVAGVMPAEFTGLVRGILNDVWVSTDAWFDDLRRRGDRTDRRGQFEIVGRLKPGVSFSSAAAQLDAAVRGEGKRKPAPSGVAGTSLQARFAPDWSLSMKLGGITIVILGLVLFVACANVVQLRLAQAEARRKELGVRFALGAGGWRVVRQLLVESGLIGLGGGLLGVVLARLVMFKAAEFISAGQRFVDFGIRLDGRVLAYSLGATLFAVLLTGLAPARHVLRLNVVEILKAEQGSTGSRLSWQKQALVAGQFAISVVFFGMAVLSIQSLRGALEIRPGLDPHRKMFIMTAAPGTRGPMAAWSEGAAARIAAVPGVRGATFARRMPLSGSGGGASVRVEIPGRAPMGVHFNNVGPNYFQVMGTRIVAGRALDAGDAAAATPVTVVSQTFARQVFGDKNPLGEWVPVNGKQRQVAGIAEDANSNDLHAPGEPFLYLPFAQMPSGDLTLIAETAGDPAGMARSIREALKQHDPRAVVFTTVTLREHMDRALAQDWMMVTLAMVLGTFGVVLTGAGLFGVLQYGVNRRTREMGLRMALGASPESIRRLVLTGSLRMAAFGAPAGILLLAACAKYLGSMVPMAPPYYPPAYLLGAAAAGLIAVAAGWLPSRRATRVDPARALRAE